MLYAVLKGHHFGLKGLVIFSVYLQAFHFFLVSAMCFINILFGFLIWKNVFMAISLILSWAGLVLYDVVIISMMLFAVTPTVSYKYVFCFLFVILWRRLKWTLWFIGRRISWLLDLHFFMLMIVSTMYTLWWRTKMEAWRWRWLW